MYQQQPNKLITLMFILNLCLFVSTCSHHIYCGFKYNPYPNNNNPSLAISTIKSKTTNNSSPNQHSHYPNHTDNNNTYQSNPSNYKLFKSNPTVHIENYHNGSIHS